MVFPLKSGSHGLNSRFEKFAPLSNLELTAESYAVKTQLA
jgi:hypothetical protein